MSAVRAGVGRCSLLQSLRWRDAESTPGCRSILGRNAPFSRRRVGCKVRDCSRVALDLGTNLLQRAPRQAGDVDLGDPHLPCDLLLAQPAEVGEVEEAALAGVEGTEAPCQQHAVLSK